MMDARQVGQLKEASKSNYHVIWASQKVDSRAFIFAWGERLAIPFLSLCGHLFGDERDHAHHARKFFYCNLMF